MSDEVKLVKAVRIADGEVIYVNPHHLEMYPKIIKPAPSAVAAEKKNGAK